MWLYNWVTYYNITFIYIFLKFEYKYLCLKKLDLNFNKLHIKLS